MGTTAREQGSEVVDLTGGGHVPLPVVDPELRAEVHRLAEEVELARVRLAPLLEQALVRLTEVDAAVCDFTASLDADPRAAEQAYEFASGVTGHARLFDALQTLSSDADAYLATAPSHPVAPSTAA